MAELIVQPTVKDNYLYKETPDANCGTETSSGSGATGRVKWMIQGVSFQDGDLLQHPFGTVTGAWDTFNDTNMDLHVTPESSPITIDHAGASELVQFRVHRKTEATGAEIDNFAADALLLGVMITYGRT